MCSAGLTAAVEYSSRPIVVAEDIVSYRHKALVGLLTVCISARRRDEYVHIRTEGHGR